LTAAYNFEDQLCLFTLVFIICWWTWNGTLLGCCWRYDVGNGFYAIAAHTDSPCLKLKPKTASVKASSYMMVNVQTYGGGLWHTWFDRDLSVAGRVILRRSDNSFVHKLVKVNRPILRIPTLAIHLDRYYNSNSSNCIILFFLNSITTPSCT
jgi:aspartyl aminopeptidase